MTTQINLDSYEIDDEPSETIWPYSSILDVDIIKNKAGTAKILQLDLLDGSNSYNGYYRHNYVLSSKNNDYSDFFRFLMDIYSGRMKFFFSNKRNQLFLLALCKTEEWFYKTYCYTFSEYISFVLDYSMKNLYENEVLSEPFSSRINQCLGICDEARYYNNRNDLIISLANHTPELVDKLICTYKKLLKKHLNDKCCCICLNVTDKLPVSFLIEPRVNVPLIVYNVEFGTMLIKSNTKKFITSKLLEMANIDTLKIALWALMPDTTLSNLLSLMDKERHLKINYNELENEDFVIGEHKVLEITEDTFNTDENYHTIIDIQ